VNVWLFVQKEKMQHVEELFAQVDERRMVKYDYMLTRSERGNAIVMNVCVCACVCECTSRISHKRKCRTLGTELQFQTCVKGQFF